jgi:hypothetical protein
VLYLIPIGTPTRHCAHPFPLPSPSLPPLFQKSVTPVFNIDDYEAPEDGSVSNIPSSVLDQINEKRIMEGKAPLKLRFGSYLDDVTSGQLDKVAKQGHDDMVFSLAEMKKFTKEIKTDPVKVGEMIDQYAEVMKQWVARPKDEATKDRLDLANWLCDYLEDAGYHYTSAPAFFKAVFVNTFPPMGRVDLAPAGPERVDVMRDMMHRYESFAHMHLKVSV